MAFKEVIVLRIWPSFSSPRFVIFGLCSKFKLKLFKNLWFSKPWHTLNIPWSIWLADLKFRLIIFKEVRLFKALPRLLSPVSMILSQELKFTLRFCKLIIFLRERFRFCIPLSSIPEQLEKSKWRFLNEERLLKARPRESRPWESIPLHHRKSRLRSFKEVRDFNA